MRPLIRFGTLLSLGLGAIAATPCCAGDIGIQGGVALLGYVPTGDELRTTFAAGGGLGGEVGLVYSRYLRLAFAVGAVYARGAPVSGPLADAAVSTLWVVPVSATLEYTLSRWPGYRPYVGAGVGLTYVREQMSFTSRKGAREAVGSATELGWQAIVGIEQNKPRAMFAELWFTAVSTGGVEDVEGTSRSLGNVQLRLGLRGRFK